VNDTESWEGQTSVSQKKNKKKSTRSRSFSLIFFLLKKSKAFTEIGAMSPPSSLVPVHRSKREGLRREVRRKKKKGRK